jgi:hypothetical protein
VDVDLNLNQLHIAPEEVDELGGLDIADRMAIAMYRVIKYQHFKQWFSLLFMEGFVLILGLIFIMPINLIALRNTGLIPHDQREIRQLLLGLLLETVFIVVLWNVYLWQQAQKNQAIAKLIYEIEKFNEIVNVIQFLDQLESIEPSKMHSDRLQNRHEVLRALQITKDTLVNALKAQKMMRSQQGLINRRYDLVADLETNLTALMALSLNSQVDDYSNLLNQALQINLSVHREIQKL